MRSRLRHSAFAWWLATFVLAGLTVSLVHGAQARATAAAARYGSARQALVVLRAVPAGAALGAVDVASRAVPSSLVPEGAVDPGAETAGRVALVDLVPGEVLVDSRLAPAGVSGPSALVAPGTRAIAIPAGATGRPPLRPGDRVDLYATSAEEVGAPAVPVAAGALVVDVDTDDDVVTVAVDDADAPRVAAAVAGASVTIALAPPGAR